MARAAAEIIEDYQKHIIGDKLEERLSQVTTQLPADLEFEGVDKRCLALPFPPDAILPTMRLIFSTMQDKVRFALSDQQINNIATGLFSATTNIRCGFYQTPA
jgi:hypothetical protein